ncbi:31360_t:CDS:2, partial [Gigaspora margarita]
MVAFANPHYRRDAFPLIKKRQTCEIRCTGFEPKTIEQCLEDCNGENEFCRVFADDGNA